MRSIIYTLVSIATVLVFGTTQAFTGSISCEASRNSKTVYNDFRSKYPFHFQTVGVAEYSDNSCLFLISEPPQTVTEGEIRQVFAEYDYSPQVMKHRLGYDGYIKDVVIIVDAVTHDQISQLENNLHKLLFSSAYKAERSTLQLPVNEGRRFFSGGNLNYQITLAELYDWFITKQELFLAPSGQKVSILTLLGHSLPGVYLSDQPGFVAWVINKDEDLSKHRSSIREFALDSDLILGAFSNSHKLVIIGRERVCPLSELPPLCTETVLMLASCPQPQLSQSLDIMDILAGKLRSKEIDWCPTFLSEELEHTEYGDLLTITDLLLKGWSECGQMKIMDFSYPAPYDYPFTKPLFDSLREKNKETSSVSNTQIDNSSISLVYNWNTNDSVYSLRMPEFCLYAISSTGALPVSYFNDQYSGVSIGKEYERTAYEYFANSKNTDLARVVQYQTLYSLFYDNSLYTHTIPLVETHHSQKAYLLADWMKTLLTNIRNTSHDECAKIVHSIAETYARQEMLNSSDYKQNKERVESHIREQIKKSGRTDSDPVAVNYRNDVWREFNRDVEQWIIQNTSSMERFIMHHITSVKDYLHEMNPMEFVKTYRYLSYPRGIELKQYVDSEIMRRIITSLNEMGNIAGIDKDIYKPFGIDLAQIMDYYSTALQNDSSPWIKTPTLTRTYEGHHAVGGHNLSVKLKRVKSLTEYDPGFRLNPVQKDARPRETIIPSLNRVHRGL